MSRIDNEYLRRWLRLALGKAELSQAEAARAIEQELNRPFHPTKMSKLLVGERELSAEEMFAFASITGQPVPQVDATGELAKLRERLAKISALASQP